MKHVVLWPCPIGGWEYLWNKDPKQLICEPPDRICDAVSWVHIPVMPYTGPTPHSLSLVLIWSHAPCNSVLWIEEERNETFYFFSIISHSWGAGQSLTHSHFLHWTKSHAKKLSLVTESCHCVGADVSKVKLSYPLQCIRAHIFL